jgi:hypothetical protein
MSEGEGLACPPRSSSGPAALFGVRCVILDLRTRVITQYQKT